MECKVCGTTGAKYYRKKRLTMCSKCAAETPDKVSRSEFDPKFWGKDYRDVPNNMRRSFYSDYLHNSCTVAEYKRDSERDDG